MSNYNKLAFAVYDGYGHMMEATDYRLTVEKDQTTLDGTSLTNFSNNPSSPETVPLTNYPYYFSVAIELKPNNTSSPVTYFLVGCNANGVQLPSNITKPTNITSGYHFQNDSELIIFQINQSGQDVTFNVTPESITFNAEAFTEANKEYFEVTASGIWSVTETN